MNINFIYKTNTFNFHLKNDVTTTYLKNLVSKIIQKDKSYFDLFYNNKIISENSSTLFQIAKNEKTISIIISLKKPNINSKSPKNEKTKLPLLSLPNKLNSNNKLETENKLYLNINDTEIDSDSSLKEVNKNTKSASKSRQGQKNQKNKKEYTTINTIFEDIYKSKENDIISLMEDLENKILEYDDFLYKKYKNSLNNDNSQLLLYEKK